MGDEKFAANLRENYFSVRNERYVVPVLASSRAEIPGIVHNARQPGQTLFVEPTETSARRERRRRAPLRDTSTERRRASGALERRRWQVYNVV